ncbi:MAG: sigma-70 family RNA polymerase sigma factor [Acidobacteria bacterium]|nr:sigma-70 family RNA polymerase sigma factor [Acidobacteriota bacterium]
MDGSDATAVAQARAGDHEAFRLLVERHSRAVFRLAFRITGNEHDADDVVQETFLRAYRQLGRFEDRSTFATWLHRIAANCATDVLRERQRRDARGPQRAFSSALGRDGWHDDTDESEMTEFPSVNDPGPERLALGSEMRERVERAMTRLSPLERAAFVLRHFEGRSIAEIGQLLGLRDNAVKHSIFRAVKKVRGALEPVLRPTR